MSNENQAEGIAANDDPHVQFVLGLLQACMTIAQVLAEVGPVGTSEELQTRLNLQATEALRIGPPGTVADRASAAIARMLAAADSTRVQMLGAGVN